MTNKRKAISPRSLLLLPMLTFACLLVAEPAWSEELFRLDQPGWGAFFGRLHMVFLHLPIGILIAAFAIELFGVFRRSRGYDVSATWLLVFGAISAWVACTTGWLLEETDSNIATASATFGWHKWLGISLAIVATLAAGLKIWAVRKQWKPAADGSGDGLHAGGAPLMLSRLGLMVIMILLPVTGHLGGNMVHQPEFLFERAPFSVPDQYVYWPEKTQAAAPDHANGGDGQASIVNASLDSWNTMIQPILKAKCVECHGVTKQKGDYRLDTLEWAMKDGEVKYAVGAGDPASGNIVPGSVIESELWVRVAVPEDHFDYMPTKGDGFTPEEIDLLANWIRDFDGKLDGPAPASLPAPANGDPQPDDDSIDEPDVTYDPAAARQITDTGAAVKPESLDNPNLMEVSFANRSAPFAPGALKSLEAAAGSVVRLELQLSAVTDADLADLPAMPRITYLNLKDTAITDSGLANLPDMPALEWVNLFGTQITDAGLADLDKYTALKKVYLTGTGVTESAVATLRAALPDTEVYTDFDLTTFASPAPPAAATPVNATCPVDIGTAIKAEFTSVYEGRTIGFCCGGCKAKFEADPASFVAELP